jgi:uncharacterized protein (DUF362 family)
MQDVSLKGERGPVISTESSIAAHIVLRETSVKDVIHPLSLANIIFSVGSILDICSTIRRKRNIGSQQRPGPCMSTMPQVVASCVQVVRTRQVARLS